MEGFFGFCDQVFFFFFYFFPFEYINSSLFCHTLFFFFFETFSATWLISYLTADCQCLYGQHFKGKFSDTCWFLSVLFYACIHVAYKVKIS